MSDSKRYFQLTPDILVEYTYNNVSSFLSQTGDASDYVFDLENNNASIVGNPYCATRTFVNGSTIERFVQPINRSESKFIQCVNGNSYIWGSDTSWTNDTSFIEQGKEDILKDTFKLHFTSRNYFGDYDGLIITVNIYDKVKNKIGLLSQYIKKTDDPKLNENPILINQKLYTTYKDFEIPNINAIIDYDILGSVSTAEQNLYRVLSPNYDIMENTPVVMTVYGVKSTYISNGFEYYNTEKLNTIFIPVEDKSNVVEVKCVEADDGDYFKIYPEVDNDSISFSDYIYNVSNGRPEDYIVFYELTLREYTPDNTNEGIVTHREQYIINAAKHSNIEDEKYKTNEDELDSIMYYRPIVINSGNIVEFAIDVNLNIINTLDNTTIVKRTSLKYSPENGKNPKKYGKHMNKIYLGNVPAQINVYNKKLDINNDGVKIVNNGGSSVKIENHQHSVIGFIECVNVGVSIEQIPKESL